MIRAVFIFFTVASLSIGEPTLIPARPFADHMVLPMEKPAPIWGKASPFAEVEIRFADHVMRGKADAEGKWSLVLPALSASSGGRDLTIVSGNETLVLRDILVGQVWLCSGQSNMDFPLAKAVGGKEEATLAAEFPAIRLLNLTGTHTSARAYTPAELNRLTPGKFFEGKWQTVTPESASTFSAVGWWAGKTIHRAKGVPVGLIDNSVGGSGAEAWLPQEMLLSRHDYTSLMGDNWLESPRVSAWARGRAKLNLGGASTIDHPFRPGFLFDAGTRDWAKFPLTGVLWYQGETNAEIIDDEWNKLLLTDLVSGWRKVLGQTELPFFMVQLPRIGGDDPLRKGWPQFRAVQATVVKELPHVSLIQTIDLGWDSPDVHPPDKRPIGERLGQAVAK
ncbi:MAG: sialate O-acetylesterase [Verrucomicrobiales bacterium]